MRAFALPLAAILALAPAAARAQACPWLGEDDAARALLAKPTETKVEKDPGFANDRGLVGSTACRFRDAAAPDGKLTVVVTEFVSYAAATAAYERELKGEGPLALPAKIGADPAFITREPGSSSAHAVKEKRLVAVTHVFGKRVREALAADPGGAVTGTEELARVVLGKL